MTIRSTILTRCRLLAAAMVLCVATAALAMEVIPLSGNAPASLADTIRSQFPGVTVSVFQNQLILNGPDHDVAQARQLVQRLDHPAESLRISVRQRTQQRGKSSNAEVTGRIGGGNANVVIGNDGPARLTLEEQNQDEQSGAVQTVLTQDGAPTYVSIGQSRPITRRTRQIINGQVVENTTTSELVDAGTGFYVQPAVRGDRVELTLYPFSERWRDGPKIESQRLSTQVTTKLGEWIEVGNTLDTMEGRQQVLLGSGRRSREQGYQVWIKVERVN